MPHVLPESIRSRLAYLLAKAHQRQLDLFAAHTRALSISGREYVTLLALEAHDDGLWQSDIAELLSLDRTTVTYLVDALEQRDWLRRERDPADRRAYVIRLTDTGVAALAEARPAARAATEELLGPLDANEQAQLRSLLGRLVS